MRFAFADTAPERAGARLLCSSSPAEPDERRPADVSHRTRSRQGVAVRAACYILYIGYHHVVEAQPEKTPLVRTFTARRSGASTPSARR